MLVLSLLLCLRLVVVVRFGFDTLREWTDFEPDTRFLVPPNSACSCNFGSSTTLGIILYSVLLVSLIVVSFRLSNAPFTSSCIFFTCSVTSFGILDAFGLN